MCRVLLAILLPIYGTSSAAGAPNQIGFQVQTSECQNGYVPYCCYSISDEKSGIECQGASLARFETETGCEKLTTGLQSS
jgi:hypothetical protein